MSLFDTISKQDNVTVVQFPISVYNTETKEIIDMRDESPYRKAFQIVCRRFDTESEIITEFASGTHALLSIEPIKIHHMDDGTIKNSHIVRYCRIDTLD